MRDVITQVATDQGNQQVAASQGEWQDGVTLVLSSKKWKLFCKLFCSLRTHCNSVWANFKPLHIGICHDTSQRHHVTGKNCRRDSPSHGQQDHHSCSRVFPFMVFLVQEGVGNCFVFQIRKIFGDNDILRKKKKKNWGIMIGLAEPLWPFRVVNIWTNLTCPLFAAEWRHQQSNRRTVSYSAHCCYQHGQTVISEENPTRRTDATWTARVHGARLSTPSNGHSYVAFSDGKQRKLRSHSAIQGN